jgi:uncharacterized metal-binding protein
VSTSTGEKGRLMTLEGTPKECADAFFILQEMVIDLERELNGLTKDRPTNKK